MLSLTAEKHGVNDVSCQGVVWVRVDECVLDGGEVEIEGGAWRVFLCESKRAGSEGRET